MSPSIKFEDYLYKELKDEAYSKEYLELALEDSQTEKDPTLFLVALRDVIEAQGGIHTFAKKIDMPKMSLYKVLSQNGNPRLDTLEKILEALGLRLSVSSLG